MCLLQACSLQGSGRQTYNMMGSNRYLSNMNDIISSHAAGVVKYRQVAQVAAKYGMKPKCWFRSSSIPHTFGKTASLRVSVTGSNTSMIAV